jgi:hypothetical protein
LARSWYGDELDVSDSKSNPELTTNKETEETLPAHKDDQVANTAANLKASIHTGFEGAMEADSASGSLRDQDSGPVKLISQLEVAVVESLDYKMPRRCTIVYDLMWELQSYLTKFFPTEQRLGDILTLTGGNFDAFGSSCKGCLQNMFQVIGPSVLGCVAMRFDTAPSLAEREDNL